MNYAEMSLVELKQLAKKRHYIKRYYVKSKEELIAILSLPTPPPEMLREKITLRDLREEAKVRGLKGCNLWALHRAELLALLYPPAPLKETAADKNEKDHRKTHEHNDPEEHDSE